jgi:hypothetical protein
MPFGLNNAPTTFQNMMNNIFILHIQRGDTNAYIDDIIIAMKGSPSTEDYTHKQAVKRVLQTFCENSLYLKPEKCVFSQPQIKYLGFVISKDHLAMDPGKVAAIKDWPTLKNLKETQSFIGFLNYY